MSKLSDMLEECHSRVIDETKIKSLLADAFNTTDEEFSTSAISFIIDSIIVGQVSAYERKSLFSAYGSIGNKMITSNKNEESKYQCQEIKREFLEHNLSKGMATFLETFNGCFVNKDALLPRIRKLFKNYKFKKVNIVNDYAILFFTFKLYDMRCNTTDDKRIQNEFADYLATECFDKLHNPHNKKAVTVTCESLLQYVKLFVENACIDAYVRIMISFVQAIHQSDSLLPYIKYDFFQRFIRHIDVINRFIHNAQQVEQNECSCSDDNIRADDYYSISEVSKFNYNSIQKAKRQEVSESTVSILKEFQKNLQWLAKNTSKWFSTSRSEFYKHSTAIYDSIMSLLKQPDEIKDISSDVLQRYRSLQLEVGDKNLSAESFL